MVGKGQWFFFFKNSCFDFVLILFFFSNSPPSLSKLASFQLSGFVKIDGTIYSVQPVAHYLDEFPELKGTGASIAISNKVLFDLYLGTGMFNSTIVEDRSQR